MDDVQVPSQLANVSSALSLKPSILGEHNVELSEASLQAAKYLFDRGARLNLNGTEV